MKIPLNKKLLMVAILSMVLSALIGNKAFAISEFKLTASDGAAWDRFGCSVSISGDTAVVGAFGDNSGVGSAYVFGYDGSTWVEKAKLTASDGAAGDYFGWSVSISGNRVVVGAYGDDTGSGSAYVFEYDGISWVEEAKLTASDRAGMDYFGWSVSISGNRVVVGAFGDDPSGSAYVFGYDGINWVEKVKLTASDRAALDHFGISVSISDQRAVVGARDDDDGGPDSGSAYMFWYDGSVEEAKLTAGDAAAGDWFGSSVSISGDMVVVGASADDNASGSAYVFGYDGNAWVEKVKLTASDRAAEDYFGDSVSISGDRVVVGAVGDDDGGTHSGSAYVFMPPKAIDIKANGSDGPLTITQGENLTVTIALDPGSHDGKDADWWVAAETPLGRYWYTLDNGWVRSDAPIRVHGGPLFEFSSREILNNSSLPAGVYTFYFAVDLIMNGSLDFDELYFDRVDVTIE